MTSRWRTARAPLIPCGTTGESATLTHEEHREVIRLTIELTRKRVPVIAGSGSNSTAEAIWLTKCAREWGADAALLITPYYNKPMQEGLYAHYMAVADAVDIPQVLYNVPARTAVSISPETAARLAVHPNIVAIKEASGSMDYVSKLLTLSDLTVLSGNDNLNLPLLALGAKGSISVLANVAPRQCADLFAAVERNDWAAAREIHLRTFGLVEALFVETNPIPVKMALHMMGLGRRRDPFAADEDVGGAAAPSACGTREAGDREIGGTPALPAARCPGFPTPNPTSRGAAVKRSSRHPRSGVVAMTIGRNTNASLPLAKKAELLSETSVSCRVIGRPTLPAGQEAALEPAVATLTEAGMAIGNGGLPVSLRIAAADENIPAAVRGQSYRLTVARGGITVDSPTTAGLFYGVQTLVQCLRVDGTLPHCFITDWPDLPLRMVMVDPARQNETFDYYRRVIAFAAHHKMNAVLLHLTDDQTACVYLPDYPELMHPHAWRESEIRDLVAYAAARHVELIPEIESFGHARMFERRTDFPDFLHEARGVKVHRGWYGTDKPGYTNVLCPASEKTYEYLDAMYAATARAFRPSHMHLGFDEVDMTSCGRCEAAGFTSQTQWFRAHLDRCRDLAAKYVPESAVWGDMLLADRGVGEGLDARNLAVYDWHYYDVDPATSGYFQKLGCRVIGSPALVCSPHMLLRTRTATATIADFARVARENGLAGLNTTIWCPTRYMSDALWTGIAFAAAQSWGGSHWDAPRFYDTFARDAFGLPDGGAFGQGVGAAGRPRVA